MQSVYRVVVLVSVITCHTAASLWAQDLSDTKVSAYAPVKEAELQLAHYLDRIGKDLGEKDTYEVEQQDRVALDATTVAVLALSLGMHDDATRFQKPAATLIELAVELADCSAEFEEAQEKYTELKAAASATEGDEETSWEPTADLVLLMQQVPIVNSALRRGVSSRRFSRSIDTTAGHAVTLAAIAQASLIDTSYCGDEEDEKEWQRICAEMRDASADAYKAVRANDQVKAKAALETIVTTCDDCHHRFRD